MNVQEALKNAPIRLEDLIGLALQAGPIMLDYIDRFKRTRSVKHDTTVLTEADTKINTLVLEEVRRISQEIDIVGEEGSDRSDSPWQVMCDPIDGTFPFVWGMPVSTFMIGVSYKHQPVMGVIFDPFMNRLYTGKLGNGSTMTRPLLNAKSDHSLSVSKIWERKDRPIVGFVSWPNEPKSPCPYNILKVCQYLEERGITLVNFCSIGYLEAAVASGELAATIFPGRKHHDTAPGHIIVTEAGGKVTDVFGRPLHYRDNQIDGHIMSNDTPIHDLIVEAVKANN